MSAQNRIEDKIDDINKILPNDLQKQLDSIGGRIGKLENKIYIAIGIAIGIVLLWECCHASLILIL